MISFKKNTIGRKPLLLFLCKVFIFSVFLLFFIAVLGYMADEGLKKTNDIHYKQWSRLYEDKNINANLLIMGSSRASCHVDPAILDRILPVHSYNLGVIGATIVLQLHAYHLYKKNNAAKPRVILMNVDWMSLDNSNGLVNRKSSFIPWANDPDWQAICDEAGFTWAEKSIPFVKYHAWGKLLIDGLSEYCGLSNSDYGAHISQYNRGYVLNYDPFKVLNINVRSSCDTISYDSSTLELFLSMRRNEKIQVLFFYSPLYKEFRERNEAYAETYPSIVRLAATWNIPFLDYSQMPECADSTYFRDNVHLSRKGAVWFTEKLAGDIDSLATRLKIKL